MISSRQIHFTPTLLLTLIFTLLIELTYGSAQSRGPVNYISRLQDVSIHSPQQRVNAFSNFDITFKLHDGRQEFRLVLEPNEDIIGDNSIISYLNGDGSIVQQPMQRESVKAFKGKALVREHLGWETVGWARVVVHRDGKHPLFDGVFSYHGDNHHIQLHSHYSRTRHELDPEAEAGDDNYVIVLRDSDVDNGLLKQYKRSLGGNQNPLLCSHDNMPFNKDPMHPLHRAYNDSLSGTSRSGLWNPSTGRMLSKRQLDSGVFGNGGFSAGINLRENIGNTRGCPTTRKVAPFGIVADCTYVEQFDGDTSAARQNILTQVNSASALYEETFNVALGLTNLIVSNVSCPATPPDAAPYQIPCSSSTTIEDRLNIFAKWRGTMSGDNNAFWTQLTSCNTGSSVGLAWLGMLCQSEARNQGDQFVSGANVVARTNTEWQVLAHEIGHTFGAVHDCDGETCRNSELVASSQCCPSSKDSCDAGGGFIMNPSTGKDITAFSPCTVGNICSAIGRTAVNSTCLSSNRNVRTITENRCGKGIVEGDEECDCGDAESCGENPCCDPETCKFINGAVCDDANEDCCNSCQFASAGTVCRPSNGACDPEEKCTGDSATCPEDKMEENGKDCGNGLQCTSGQCTSRNEQCRSVMGQLAGGSNDTRACDDTDCRLTCTSPSFGNNVCYGLQQWYLDGTSCSAGGRCKSGVCEGSNVINEIKSFVDKNKNLVIGLSAGIGGAIVLLVAFCCFRRCKSKRRKVVPPAYIRPGTTGAAAQRSGTRNRSGSRSRSSGSRHASQQNNDYYPSQPVVPPMQQYFGSGYGNDNVMPPAYNPPTYGQQSPLSHQRSVRYA